MRIINARCSVTYSGRGDTILPEYDRVIIMKNDNSVMIHSDKGIKPLNYMTGNHKTSYIVENIDGLETWVFENTKENLRITFHHTYFDTTLTMGQEEPGLIHDGTEMQLQEWLSNNITVLSPNYEFIQREYVTDNGPVDILAYDHVSNENVLVEVKRVATTASLHQVKRYVDGAEDLDNVNKLLVAYDVRPKTREKALKMGIPWIELETDNNGGYVVKNSSTIFKEEKLF